MEDELTIVYEKNVVALIDGIHLYGLLRSVLSKVGRGECVERGEKVEFKKWLFSDQERVRDVISCPFTVQEVCDIHRSSPQREPHFLSVGERPPVSLFNPTGKDNESLSSVALTIGAEVAQKIKEQIFSFASSWGFGEKKKPAEEEKRKVEKAAKLGMSWGINDWSRSVLSVLLSPNCELAATTDRYGRVLLLDMHTYTFSRMWKGYRDAQVGFLEQRMDMPQNKGEISGKTGAKNKVPLFLAIYAPLRGLLEVWKMKHGGRESMVNVGLGCKLLTTHKLFGAGNESTHSPCKLYLLHAEGDLEEIIFSESLNLQVKSDQKKEEQVVSLIECILRSEKNELGEIEVSGEQEEKLQLLLGEIIYPKTLVKIVKKLVSVPVEFDLQSKLVSQICEEIRESEKKERQEKLKKKQKHYQTNSHELSQLICIEKLMHFFAEVSSASVGSHNLFDESTERLSSLLEREERWKCLLEKAGNVRETGADSLCLFSTFFSNLDISNTSRVSVKEDALDSEKVSVASFLFSSVLSAPDEMLAELIETLVADVKLTVEEVHSLFLLWFFESASFSSLLRMPTSNLYCVLSVTQLLEGDSLESLLQFCFEQTKIDKLCLFTLSLLECFSHLPESLPLQQVEAWKDLEQKLGTLAKIFVHLPPEYTVSKNSLETSEPLCKLIASMETKNQFSETLGKWKETFPDYFENPNVIRAYKCRILFDESKRAQVLDVEKLSEAISVSQQIKEDAELRGGIQVLIWEQSVQKVFMQIVELVENKKKYPSERECAKLNFSGVESCLQFLKASKELICDVDSQLKLEKSAPELKKECWPPVEGNLLQVSRKCLSKYDNKKEKLKLEQTLLLSLVLESIVANQMRDVSPSLLFEPKYALFGEKKEANFSFVSLEEELFVARLEFLVQLFPKNEETATLLSSEWKVDIKTVKERVEQESKEEKKEKVEIF